MKYASLNQGPIENHMDGWMFYSVNFDNRLDYVRIMLFSD